MKDLNGKQIEPGMVMMEIGRGGKYTDKTQYYSLKLWEYSNNYNGQGLGYSIDGRKHEWWHASARNSYILNKSEIPEEFIFSFYHGMSDLYTTIKSGTVEELINNSDWKNNVVLKNDIDNYCELKSTTINNIADIKNSIPLMEKSKYIPRCVVESVIRVAGQNIHNVINGESGVAAFYDNILFNQIILYFKSEAGGRA